MQERISADGMVMSQFWPDASPSKHSFPMRNAIMSAYGQATVVVEAGEHSGARIQARLAVAHGRPVILTDAVANGTNWGRSLIGKPGVFVAWGAEDVIERVAELIDMDSRASELLSQVAG